MPVVTEEELAIEELILRDHLALDRTRLANERTILAYLRTALMLIITGATATKFVGDTPGVVFTGWTFIICGGLVGMFGAWRFVHMRQKINRRYSRTKEGKTK